MKQQWLQAVMSLNQTLLKETFEKMTLYFIPIRLRLNEAFADESIYRFE